MPRRRFPGKHRPQELRRAASEAVSCGYRPRQRRADSQNNIPIPASKHPAAMFAHAFAASPVKVA